MILLWVTGLMDYGFVKTIVSFRLFLFLFIINLIWFSYEFGVAHGLGNASSFQVRVRLRGKCRQLEQRRGSISPFNPELTNRSQVVHQLWWIGNNYLKDFVEILTLNLAWKAMVTNWQCLPWGWKYIRFLPVRYQTMLTHEKWEIQDNRFDWIWQMAPAKKPVGTDQTLHQLTKLIPARLRGDQNMPKSSTLPHFITYK